MEKSDNKLGLIFSPLIFAHKNSPIVNLFSDRRSSERTKSQAAGGGKLRVCNLITTGTTILTGRSTNVTTSPAADDGG